MPRCLARAGISSPLFESPLNALELRAVDPRLPAEDGKALEAS